MLNTVYTNISENPRELYVVTSIICLALIVKSMRKFFYKLRSTESKVVLCESLYHPTVLVDETVVS